MDITFSAANTVGLNNPGTEIITLVKDGSGNFINPPSYDKMRAYLRSGEVPMLFVTDEAGKTGSLYQLDEYSETENKIRFSNPANAIEFCAGAVAPNVVAISSGGSADFVINGTINSNTEVTLDKTFAQIQAAIQEGSRRPYISLVGGEILLPLVGYNPDAFAFAAVVDASEGTITSIGIIINADDTIIFNRSLSPTLNSDGTLNQYPMEADPISPMEIATKQYVDNKECILKSTTPGSTKKFKITVDDSGNISATEVI